MLSFFQIEWRNIEARITEAINYTNDCILSEVGFFKGMKTTFIILVIEKDKNKVSFVSIGDSRLYKIDKKDVSQLSKDEIKVVIRRKQDGTPITVNGAIVNAAGITNCIGVKPLPFEIQSLIIQDTTSFFITTDGYYSQVINLNERLENVSQSIDLKGQFKQLSKEVNSRQKDDATAIFLRINIVSANNSTTIDTILNKKDNNLSKLEISTLVKEALVKSITTKKSKLSLKLIKYITDNGISLGFDYYDNIIKTMFKVSFNNTEVYQKFISLMKQSKI